MTPRAGTSVVTRASLLGARMLLGAPGLTTRNKKLLVTRALEGKLAKLNLLPEATRMKYADRWP